MKSYLNAAIAIALVNFAPVSAQDANEAAEVPAEAAATAAAEIEVPVPLVPAAQYASGSIELPEAEAQSCELHIWPAERMNSVTTGLLGGGLLDAAIHSGTDANNKTLIASALDSPSQLDALQELDLRALLDLEPGTRIVRHEDPLERKTMNKIKTRRAESGAPCYSELIVADVLYQKAMIYGRSLKTLFMVRDFGDDQIIDRQYKSWGGNGLSLFPPKEGEDAIAALDELVSVFQGNFREFANKAGPALAAR